MKVLKKLAQRGDRIQYDLGWDTRRAVARKGGLQKKKKKSDGDLLWMRYLVIRQSTATEGRGDSF